MVRLHLIEMEDIGHVIIAVSMIGGAITSFKGNRAWFTHSVFDADEPLRSPASRTVSIVIGVAGVLIAARIVCLRLMAIPRSSHQHLNSPLLLPILMMAALLMFVVIHAIKTGTALGPGFTIDREESPFVFWIYIATLGLSLIAGFRLVLG